MTKYVRFFPLAAMVAAIMFSVSCKKVVDNKPTDDGDGGDTTGVVLLDTANSTMQDRLYDTMYLYALQTYYWNTQLPDYATFLPRQYKNVKDSLGLAQELFQITRFPKDGSGYLYEQRIKYDKYGDQQPDNSAPKYSSIVPTNETVNGGAGAYTPVDNGFTKNAKMTLDGKDSSLGFIVGLLPARYSDDSTQIVNSGIVHNLGSIMCAVRFVIKGSPADQLGLKRGDIIFKVDGDTLDFDNRDDASSAALDRALNATSTDIGVYYPKGDSSAILHIQQQLYTFNPIFKSETLDYGGKKIGYIAFYTFSDISNAQYALDTAFQSFASKGITDLVVDLRYNGGGYINTSEYFADLIAPSSANGQKMYTAYYNSMMVNKQATILKSLPLEDYPGKTYFDIDYTPEAQTEKIIKAGSVNNLTKVYFIVSSGTASASELLINNIKAYVPVTLIGAAYSDNGELTYGKPVGFFEEKIGAYSMWIPNFETKNATGAGGYYKGMETGYQVFDDVTRDFGDPKEDCLAGAIYLISGVNTEAVSGKNIQKDSKVKRAIMQTRSIGQVNKISNMVIKPKKVFNQ